MICEICDVEMTSMTDKSDHMQVKSKSEKDNADEKYQG